MTHKVDIYVSILEHAVRATLTAIAREWHKYKRATMINGTVRVAVVKLKEEEKIFFY
jgi:hypothetical protein